MQTATQATADGRLTPAFIALFLLANIMPPLAIYGTAPILPLLDAYYSHLSMAPGIARATLTGGSLGIVIGAPLTSYLDNWFRRKTFLVSAAGLFTVAGLTGYFVDSLPMIIISRFFVGVAAAVVTTTTVTIVGETCDDVGRSRWMGIMIGVGTLLTMAMFPLVGVLGDFGWHDAFLIHLIGLPITILAWWTYPHSTPGVSRRISPAPPVHLDLIVLGLCIGIAINPQSIYAPFKLEAIGLHSATKIGFAMMTVPFFASITSPFYVRIRRRASVSVVFTLGFAGLGLGLALFVAGTGLAAALCGYALFGAALGFVAPNMYVVGSRFSGSSHHSAALGQILAGFYSSSLIAQIAIEPWFGTRPIHALAALAGFCILLSVLSLFFRTRSPSPPTAREANVAGQSSPRDA